MVDVLAVVAPHTDGSVTYKVLATAAILVGVGLGLALRYRRWRRAVAADPGAPPSPGDASTYRPAPDSFLAPMASDPDLGWKSWMPGGFWSFYRMWRFARWAGRRDPEGLQASMPTTIWAVSEARRLAGRWRDSRR